MYFWRVVNLSCISAQPEGNTLSYTAQGIDTVNTYASLQMNSFSSLFGFFVDLVLYFSDIYMASVVG